MFDTPDTDMYEQEVEETYDEYMGDTSYYYEDYEYEDYEPDYDSAYEDSPVDDLMDGYSSGMEEAEDAYEQLEDQAESEQESGEEQFAETQEESGTEETTGESSGSDPENSTDDPISDQEPEPPTDPRLEWEAFALPEGVEFTDSTLSAEAYLDDLLSFSPESEESFTTETLYVSDPVIEATDSELGVGEKTTETQTLITLSQEWISPTEWTITQTKEETFLSNEQSKNEDDVDDEFDRIVKRTLTITIINGTHATVSYSSTDTFTFATSLVWGNEETEDDETADGEEVAESPEAPITSEEEEDSEEPSSEEDNEASEETPDIDQGNFSFSHTISASTTSTFEWIRITMPDGSAGTREIMSLGSTFGYETASSFSATIDQSEGEMDEEPFSRYFKPLGETEDENGDESGDETEDTGTDSDTETEVAAAASSSEGDDESEAENDGDSDSEPVLSGNGSAIKVDSKFDSKSGSNTEYGLTVTTDIPDDELLETVETAVATFSTSSHSDDSNSNSLNIKLQESGAGGAEYFTESSESTSSSKSNFSFGGTVLLTSTDLAESETEGAGTEGEADSVSENTTDIEPEISLEMSLENSSTRTDEVRYLNIAIIAPENSGGDQGTHTITYHSKPVSTTSFDFDISPGENGDLSLSDSSTVTTGYDMTATDVLDVEHPYDPDSEFMAIEMVRTEKNTRTVKETERTTETTTMTINVTNPESHESDGTTEAPSNDGTETAEAQAEETSDATDGSSQGDDNNANSVTFKQTFSITASGSDIRKSDITWHTYQQQEDDGSSEFTGEVPGTVFLYDLHDVDEESTTYNYSNNSEDGPSGTLTHTTSYSYDYLDPDGNISADSPPPTTTETDLANFQPEPAQDRSVDDILAEYQHRVTQRDRLQNFLADPENDLTPEERQYYTDAIVTQNNIIANLAQEALEAGVDQTTLDSIGAQAGTDAGNDPIDLLTIDDFNDEYDDSDAPGYFHFLTNPSDMDDDLEVAFYVAATTAALAGSAAGVLYAAPIVAGWWGSASAWASSALAAEAGSFTLPTMGWIMTAEGTMAWGVVGTTTYSATVGQVVSWTALLSAPVFAHTIDWDNFDEFGDDLNTFEKMPEGDNTAHNAKFDHIVRELKLNQDKADELHRAISKKGYSLEEIREIALQILGQ